MFVLGHVGIGRRLVGARGRALAALPLAVGMFLPDLIDKPLYYSHLSSFVSCTRTFGHTGLFLLAIVAVAAATRSRLWMALGAGVATHTPLDFLLDLTTRDPSSAFVAFTWPFYLREFFRYEFRTPLDQLIHLANWRVIAGEIIGLALLVLEYRRRRTRRA